MSRIALRTLQVIRDTMKPVLPSGGHQALRTMFYGSVLPAMRTYDAIAERMGKDFSQAPPPSILAQYGMASADAYTRIAGKEARTILHHLKEAGIALPETPRILDFGCGAAGPLSALHDLLPGSQAYGCDLKDDVLAWVRKYRPSLTVRTTAPQPPLPADYKDFDLIVSVSVWTHMPPGACQAWLDHMHERLKPGGAFVLTVISPDRPLVRRHGFDPATLPKIVRDAGGCFYDAGKDMSYIDRQWFEEQPLFELHYYGEPKEIGQQIVVLTKR